MEFTFKRLKENPNLQLTEANVGSWRCCWCQLQMWVILAGGGDEILLYIQRQVLHRGIQHKKTIPQTAVNTLVLGCRLSLEIIYQDRT